MISIHAPREGRDSAPADARCRTPISIHAPREGRDEAAHAMRLIGILFQSTRPARGATMDGDCVVGMCPNFNPRAPRGARRLHTHNFGSTYIISIHAPREGRDKGGKNLPQAEKLFQSTRPARGATAGGDIRIDGRSNFNPRAPRGARHIRLTFSQTAIAFQSTRPARGAT